MCDEKGRWMQGFVAQLRADLHNILRDPAAEPARPRDFRWRRRRRVSRPEDIERFVNQYPKKDDQNGG